jgi:hypothetical protein
MHPLRRILQWTQEDCVRLMGQHGPRFAAWESTTRTMPPLRPADLLMTRVVQAVRTIEVPVRDGLLDEAEEWTAFPFGVFDVCHRSSSCL